MTGEMYYADPEEYPLHFAIARATEGTVTPFDVYQGPYVSIGEDITSGDAPYTVTVQGLGCVRLWIMGDGDGDAQVYREDTDTTSPWFPVNCAMSEACAVSAAMDLLQAETTS